MLTIPEQYAENIQQILVWHLSAYVPDKMFNISIKRILERFNKGNIVQLDDKELYYIKECVADAKNNVLECGVERVIANEIFDWIYPEYNKKKHLHA